MAVAAIFDDVFAECLLQHVGVGRVDALVVVLLGFHHFEAEMFVELDGRVVVHLHVPARSRI